MELHLEIAGKHFLDGARLVRTQYAVVHENTGQLFSDGLVDQRCGDTRVHATAQSENHLFLAGLSANFLNSLIDVIAHGPLAAATADFADEVRDDFFTLRRVNHFRMKLKAVKAGLGVFDCSKAGVFRGGNCLEAVRQHGQFVAVGIPNLQFPG